MELRTPFNPLQQYLRDPNGAAALRPPAPVVLPPNAPPQLAQQVWQAAAQQAMQGVANAAVEVGYSLVNAVLESTRSASEFRTSGTLTASRNMNGEIRCRARTGSLAGDAPVTFRPHLGTGPWSPKRANAGKLNICQGCLWRNLPLRRWRRRPPRSTETAPSSTSSRRSLSRSW